MQGQHVAPRRWRSVLLTIADWAVRAGLRACSVAVALFVVAPMSVRRRIAGPRSAPAGPRR